MDSKKEENGKLQRIYRDVINGYSVFKFAEDNIFVKHLSPVDLGNIQERDEQIYQEAKDKGLPTEEEKLKMLIEQEIWSEWKEKEIAQLKTESDRLSESLAKLVVQSQIERQRTLLDKVDKKLADAQKERVEFLGLTCEFYSKKQLNQEYLKYSLRTSDSLEERYLDEKKYNLIPDGELDALTLFYNAKMAEITHDSIKKIAASPFFLNTFLICKNDPTVFYGKGVCYLTNYQIDLFSNGQRYKSVLEQAKSPPPALYDDIQLVVDWYESQLGTKVTMNKENMAGGTVFGASESEIKQMVGTSTDDRETVSLGKEVGKTGKKQLNMNELLKLHGEI